MDFAKEFVNELVQIYDLNLDKKTRWQRDRINTKCFS